MKDRTREEDALASETSDAVKPSVVIEYCPKCGWMLRAAWLAQELLTTFQDRVLEVSLRPAGKAVFRIRVGEAEVWSRQRDGGFPAAAELKRRVRDVVDPSMELGHSEGGSARGG
jgi:selenoprotein W-related protein